MKYLLLILLSLNIFAVQQGDIISASKFNSSMLSIGTIQQSLLTLAQFQSLQGSCWVKMEGQDITGSDFANLTGMTTLPNASGKFLRSTGGTSPNIGPALGQTQLDAFQSHRHDNIGTIIVDDPDIGDDSIDWYSSHAHSNDAGHHGNPIGNPITDGVNGTPRTAKETRPINIGVNYFIKINKVCN